jgi:hypothetical protein
MHALHTLQSIATCVQITAFEVIAWVLPQYHPHSFVNLLGARCGQACHVQAHKLQIVAI